jgi:aminopeptidase
MATTTWSTRPASGTDGGVAVRGHEGDLRAYAELAITVGLNLRRGQRLLIIGPLANGGVALEAAPLVRSLTECAYRVGATLVEAVWGDESLQVARLNLASQPSFETYSRWLPEALAAHVAAGDAIISVYANDPDLLKDFDPQRVSAVQQSTARAVRLFRDRIARNDTNWSVVAAASPAWARKVFPDLAPEAGVARLWDAIRRLCRLDATDPAGAWRSHLRRLAMRRDFLNTRRFKALHYTGPGTDLTVGLPDGHLWVSGQSTSRNGILFAPNLPTEEVFTMPHKDRVSGVVTSSKPLSYGSALIDGFRLEFEGGRVVRASAATGESLLRELMATDPGAARLGEVALVPHGSPISQSGLLFYNTLFDENAASHLAFGSAYKFTMEQGEAMADDAFEAAGGNRSAVHVDFMIGSGELDVEGICRDGSSEPLMHAGEWVS